ncbi:MAG: FKBP-type peptidyl-prolyl cis-trans isomerase [Verrucomicrobia bacterium]|nr:MAG: FKBP-type peptidyl-prolyl cis-trans isomerase [Verrucomicrobiota bacterium]
MILTRSHRLIALCLVLVFSSAGSGAGPRGSFSADDEEIIETQWPGYLETPSGLRYIIEREGTGEKPLRGMKISVVYTGFLIDGTKFGENNDREKPFELRLGSGEVILGWEEALADMREGEMRILIIPYALAYGLRGRGEGIPRRSTLIFRVEVVEIEG